MTEAVIGKLAGIGELRVTSRTSVMRFKDSKETLPQIAKGAGCGCGGGRVSDTRRNPHTRERAVDSGEDG